MADKKQIQNDHQDLIYQTSKAIAKIMLNFCVCVGNQTAGSNSMSLDTLILTKIQDGRQ